MKLQVRTPNVFEFVFCFVGVLVLKVLDLVGERLTFANLSLGYVGFAIVIALLFTVLTDSEPIPPTVSADKRRKILQRVARNALMAGLGWQAIFEKVQGFTL